MFSSGFLLSVLERLPWDTANPVPPLLLLMITENTSKGVLRSGAGKRELARRGRPERAQALATIEGTGRGRKVGIQETE